MTTKQELVEYKKGNKDAREAAFAWMKENKGMTITDRLLQRFQDEV